MKILFISRSLPYLGGREKVVEDLMDGLKKKHKIFLITPDRGKTRKGVKMINIDKSSLKIDKFVKEQNPSVISCHTFYLADLAIRLSKKFNIPLVFTLHGVFIKFYDRDYSSILRKIYNNSSLVTTVSGKYKKHLEDLFEDKKQERIKVIRNGVDVPVLVHTLEQKNEIRKKFRLPLNKKIIIIPARLNKIKGLNYAVEAAIKIKKTNPDVLFLISSPKGRKSSGEGLYKKELLRLTGSSNNIKFINLSHEELLSVFPVCDVCLLPSLIEGISISILEAMSLGLIVAASRVGGNIEIIDHKNNGFLFKPKSSIEIVKTIKYIINLPDRKRMEISKNSQKTVRYYFSKKEMLKSYELLFKETILKHENKQ